MTINDPQTDAPPRILRVSEFAAAGGFLGDGRHLGRNPDLHQIRRGAYIDCATWEGLSATDRHLHLVNETMRVIATELVVSDRSAAALWGIPYLGQPPAKVEVTVERAKAGRHSRHLSYHTTRSMPEPVDLNGVRVTSPSRTAVDIARRLGFASGLMAFDAVLRGKLATIEGLATAIEALPRRIDRCRAEAVLARADGRAESPAESLARARMYQIGAPIPDLQREFSRDGVVVGRVDFYWEDADCIGEMDGEVKYRKDGLGRTAEDVVIAEKHREDALRRLVAAFVRFIWNDALKTAPMETELRRVGVLTGPAVRRFGL